jgi:hypothetical protein
MISDGWMVVGRDETGTDGFVSCCLPFISSAHRNYRCTGCQYVRGLARWALKSARMGIHERPVWVGLPLEAAGLGVGTVMAPLLRTTNAAEGGAGAVHRGWRGGLSRSKGSSARSECGPDGRGPSREGCCVTVLRRHSSTAAPISASCNIFWDTNGSAPQASTKAWPRGRSGRCTNEPIHGRKGCGWRHPGQRHLFPSREPKLAGTHPS